MKYLETDSLGKLFRVMHAANKTHHLIALTEFFCGARISQILKLRGEDVFEHEGKIVIKFRAIKGGFERLQHLHFDVQPEFDMSPLIELAKRRPTSLLFGGTSRQYFNLSLKRYCVAAGIHTDFGHSHCLRHSIAVAIWNSTHNLGAISWFLAHKSPTSALVYLQANDGKIGQEAVDGIQLA